MDLDGVVHHSVADIGREILGHADLLVCALPVEDHRRGVIIEAPRRLHQRCHFR